jgi:FlaA1/EpsC-like NDP-sugar epimerase
MRSDNPRLIPVGFLDDDPKMEGKFINDVPILGGHWRLGAVLQRKKISKIFLSNKDINPNVLRRIRKVADQYSVPIVLSQIQFREINTHAAEIDSQGKIVAKPQEPDRSVKKDVMTEQNL